MRGREQKGGGVVETGVSQCSLGCWNLPQDMESTSCLNIDNERSIPPSRPSSLTLWPYRYTPQGSRRSS